MKKNTTKMVAFGGVIAALYVVLTIIAAALGIASGAIQVRLSEALTILPVFTAAAVPGLTVGCVVANLITGCAAWAAGRDRYKAVERQAGGRLDSPGGEQHGDRADRADESLRCGQRGSFRRGI